MFLHFWDILWSMRVVNFLLKACQHFCKNKFRPRTVHWRIALGRDVANSLRSLAINDTFIVVVERDPCWTFDDRYLQNKISYWFSFQRSVWFQYFSKFNMMMNLINSNSSSTSIWRACSVVRHSTFFVQKCFFLHLWCFLQNKMYLLLLDALYRIEAQNLLHFQRETFSCSSI